MPGNAWTWGGLTVLEQRHREHMEEGSRRLLKALRRAFAIYGVRHG